MGCPDDNTLSRVLDGTLPASERAALEAHADSCEACAATLVHLARSFLTTAPASTDVPASTSAPLPGGADRYRLGPPIGSGGMGTVHSAFDRVLGRSVAVKLLRADAVGPGIGKAQLLQEARAMARVTDPHVVSVYDAGEGPDGVYLAMELVRGPTLRGWISGQPRSFEEILARFLEAGRGLVAAHEAGIVHRDFKPENVLVGADGRARVTDFGLARPGQDGDAPVSVPASMTGLSVGRFAGTPAYMAPEQLDGADVTAKTDQYAFCVALHEAAYGARPFVHEAAGRLEGVRQSTDVRRHGLSAEPTWEGVRSAMRRGPVRPQERDVPTWLWPILARGLSERPEDRYPSMRELVASLEHDGKRGAEWHLAVHVAALCTLACAYLGISILVIVGIATAGDAPEDPPEPWYVQAFAGWLAVLIATGWAPVSVVWAPVTALGIHRRRGWAYPLLAIYAGLSLFSGIGTIYGAYALWSLRLPAVRRALGRRDDPPAR